MTKVHLRAASLLFTCAFSMVFMSACGNGLSKQYTSPQDLVANPEGPRLFYPFHRVSKDDGDYLTAKDWTDKFPLQVAQKGCDAVVTNLQVLTSGKVEGPLKCNFSYRHADSGDDQDYGFKEVTDDNTDLGPVEAGNLYLYFKYEGKIVFAGNKDHCFFGQMACDPTPIQPEKGPVDIVFKPALPDNDAVGVTWWAKKDLPFPEFKKKYPILDIDGDNVRFIQAPGGPAGMMNIGMEGKKMYVIVYAGACKRITKLKLYRIAFPAGKHPQMDEVKPTELKNEVKSFSYAEID